METENFRKEDKMIVQVKKRAQITLPKKVREKLEIQEGDVLEVILKEEAVVLKPRPSDKILVRAVAAQGLKQLSGLVSVGGNALLS